LAIKVINLLTYAGSQKKQRDARRASGPTKPDQTEICSQAAQHCCNDDQQSQWENGEFDPCRSETPENVITKIGHIDKVAGGKFYGNRPRGVRPTNS